MRIVYLGTPDFAVIPLEALARDPRYELVGVVTQPDRPVGRGGAVQAPPVKQAALRLGLPVLQPETLREPAAAEALAALRPDVGVVAAYGEILRKRVLAIPPLGYLNIHPSLLPRWRGPTPVTGAIMAGDTEIGVSVMRLDTKMDSGPLLAQRRLPLAPDARGGALTEELFHIGAALLLDVLAPYAAGTLLPTPQDDSLATYTHMLTRADGQIDWAAPAAQIERMVRAYDPWPAAFTLWRGQPLKITDARVHPWPGDAPPGTLLPERGAALVATGADALELLVVQPAGKRPMPAADWRRGLREQQSVRLGE
ncbi:MAG: methionyl-tRNA formyltransferase [Roseiflexaceae bacterium]